MPHGVPPRRFLFGTDGTMRGDSFSGHSFDEIGVQIETVDGRDPHSPF
jgi:hypothetical protein